jgi:hypothetical protein
MSGNLAYELHGPIDDGPEIYDAVYRAGRLPRFDRRSSARPRRDLLEERGCGRGVV